MNNGDPLFDQALEFLENDGDIPTQIKSTKDKFLVACLKHLYGHEVITRKKATKNHDRLIRIEAVLGIGGSGGLLILILKLCNVI